MKNSFFSRFTPKEPKFFPLLKQLSEVLCKASVVLTESLQHDSPTERADYYKKIKELSIRIVTEGILNRSIFKGERWRKENGFKTPLSLL